MSPAASTRDTLRPVTATTDNLRPLDHDFKPSIRQLVLEAIKDSGTSTALGPDNLNTHHLGPAEIQYVTHLLNLSIAHADILAIWRKAIIIAIPKPGKPNTQGSSYRPISLLSPSDHFKLSKMQPSA